MRILIKELYNVSPDHPAGGTIQVFAASGEVVDIKGFLSSRQGSYTRELRGKPPFTVEAEDGTVVDYMIVNGESLPQLNTLPQPGTTWVHHTGRVYFVESIARSELDELLVIHRGLDGQVWSRTVGNFLGLKDGVPRFFEYKTGGAV